MTQTPEHITLAEAARRYGVCLQTIYTWSWQGKIKMRTVAGHRIVIWRAEDEERAKARKEKVK